MIIEPKWSLRPGDWDLIAFNIIPILVGAIPSNSLLVYMAFSNFLSKVRWGDLHQYLILAYWKIQLSDAKLQIGISAKLKQFIVSVKQKIKKVVISSKKAQRNLQEQTVYQMISEVVESCMIPDSNPVRELLFLLSEKLISFRVQCLTRVYLGWILS